MKFEFNKKYTTIATYALIVVFFSIICLYFALHINDLGSIFSLFGRIFSPIVYGAIFAYILNPLLKFFENKVFISKETRLARKNAKKEAMAKGIKNKFKLEKIMLDAAEQIAAKNHKTRVNSDKKKTGKNATVDKIRDLRKGRSKLKQRALSMVFTYSIFIAAVIFLFSILLPQIVNSLTNIYEGIYSIITNLPTHINALGSKYKWFKITYDFFSDNFDFSEDGIARAITSLLGNSAAIVSFVRDVLGTFINEVKNILLGIVFSVYFLGSKEMLHFQFNNIIDALLKPRVCSFIRHVFTQFDRKFGQFLQGKIIDSIIIGLMSFVVFAIFGIPYYQLIAVVVGITNVIPFFGPFIGAIPSGIIIMLVEPDKVLLFIILIIIIQQIDGNLIGPRILGSSIDLSPMWVMVAIIVMSGLFGGYGMFFGVPIFAVIYTLVSEAVNRRLAVKLAAKLVKETRETDFVDFLNEKDDRFRQSKETGEEAPVPGIATPDGADNRSAETANAQESAANTRNA